MRQFNTIPSGVQFSTIKPQGVFQEYRDYWVTPVQTYTNNFSINDIIRIQFNLQDWYIDPYESYIEAQVQLADESAFQPLKQYMPNQTYNTSGVKFYMMDGPSTSLINDFRFEVNSVEIERCREYDQVGNLLMDLNMYPDVVDQKDFEGYYSIRGNQTIQTGINVLTNHQMNKIGASNTSAAFEVISYINKCPILQQGFPNSVTANGEPVYISHQFGLLSDQTQQINLANITDIVQANASGNTQSAISTLQVINPAQQLASVSYNPNGFSNSQIFGYTSYLGSLTAGNTNFGIQNYSTTDNNFNNLFLADSPKLSQIDGHNFILTNLPCAKIYKGQFVNSPYNNVYQTQNSRCYMQIPLLSGVMGVLIPQDRWQLIPSSSLGYVNMEFRLNPFAFITHDGSQPNWIITQFQLRIRMYKFDAALMSQLKAQIGQGIQLHSQVFSMGPIYSIYPNVSVTNNWQLNNGIPSIKHIFFWFLADDYESKSYCRKNYKLSMNITSMQLKNGSTYLPQTPIQGHAGQIVQNTTSQYNNAIFLSELQQSVNCLFSVKKHININQLNFAINDRPYDIYGNFIMGVETAQQPNNYFRQEAIDQGWFLWNEMRCRGKAVYSFNLEMDKKNDYTMSGLDTTRTRPIELILKSDEAVQFSRNSVMYVMFLSDFIVTFLPTETKTEGQG